MSRLALSSVSVCFPVYNEETTVEEVVAEAHDLLSRSGLDHEIIVCDDGSTDRSPEIIRSLAKKLPGLKVITHKHNMGIYETFEDLYLQARKDYVFLNSVDKQWQTGIVLDLIKLTDSADIVVAARKTKPYGAFRAFVSWAFNVVGLVLFGVNTYDAGSVKLVKTEVIRNLRLVSRSPFSEAERLIRAQRAGYKIISYPVDVSRRRTGHAHGVKFKILLTSMADVFRVWYSIRFKKDKDDEKSAFC